MRSAVALADGGEGASIMIGCACHAGRVTLNSYMMAAVTAQPLGYLLRETRVTIINSGAPGYLW
ncbi:hypothetical protein D3C80_1726820 [compost metagenome]